MLKNYWLKLKCIFFSKKRVENIAKILIENIVRSFRFSNNNQDLLVVTKDCKIRFYSLNKFEGIFLREIQNCHRGAVSALDISANSGYMITGGQDNLINLWDYDA